MHFGEQAPETPQVPSDVASLLHFQCPHDPAVQAPHLALHHRDQHSRVVRELPLGLENAKPVSSLLAMSSGWL